MGHRSVATFHQLKQHVNGAGRQGAHTDIRATICKSSGGPGASQMNLFQRFIGAIIPSTVSRLRRDANPILNMQMSHFQPVHPFQTPSDPNMQINSIIQISRYVYRKEIQIKIQSPSRAKPISSSESITATLTANNRFILG